MKVEGAGGKDHLEAPILDEDVKLQVKGKAAVRTPEGSAEEIKHADT